MLCKWNFYEGNSFLTFYHSINWACKLKISLIVLCRFSDIADKKRKIANSFWTTNSENMFSKVAKPIEMWVIDALKRLKNVKVFLCNDIDHIISKICRISRQYKFPALNQRRNSVYLEKLRFCYKRQNEKCKCIINRILILCLQLQLY